MKARAAYCSSCGYVVYPADGDASDCGECGAAGLVWIHPEGTVYTFTVVHAGPPGMLTPYAVGYVDFEKGVRAFGRIAGGDATIGMRVVPTSKGGGLFFERRREEEDR